MHYWKILLSLTGTLLIATPLLAQGGLVGEYYDGENFERKIFERTDAAINFNWRGRSPGPGVPESYFSVRWTGRLMAPKTGDYVFSAKVDDGIRVWVGNTLVINAWGLHDDEQFKGSMKLEQNKYYDLKVEYFNSMLEGEIRLMWMLPGENSWFNSPKAIESRYFSQNPPPQPVEKKAAPPTKPKPKPKPKAAPKPKPKPSTPPTQTPPLPAPAPPQPASPIPGTGNPELKNIYFIKSKDEMTAGSLERLEAVTAYLKKYPSASVELSGHTDNLGDADKNQQLSEDRASVVAQYLFSRGIAQERVRTKGYGGARPYFVRPLNDKERDQNRRVEFVIKTN